MKCKLIGQERCDVMNVAERKNLVHKDRGGHFELRLDYSVSGKKGGA